MFNERIYDRISHVWAPEVLTAHRYPTTPLALVADMFRRARRRLPAEFAPATLRQPMTTLLAELRARLLFRQRLARLLVPDMAGLGLTPGLGSGGRLAVRQLIRAIRYAEFWGTASRLPALARAGRQLERLEALQQTRTADADRTAPGQALRITQRLRRRFPLIWQFHMAAATGLAQAATGPQAQNDTQTKNDTQAKATLAAYQQATALIPDQSAPVLALCTWLESRGQHGLSQAQAEWAAIMAPTQSLFLQRARYPALKAGHLAEALLAAQATLLRDPVRPALHRDLAQVYSMMGQPDMAQRRLQMAEALEQSGR